MTIWSKRLNVTPDVPYSSLNFLFTFFFMCWGNYFCSFPWKMGTAVGAYAAGLCRASSAETLLTLRKGKGWSRRRSRGCLWYRGIRRLSAGTRKASAPQRGQDSSSSPGVAGGYLSCKQLSPTGSRSSQVCRSSSRAIHYSTADAVTAPSSCDDWLSQYP